MEQQQNNVSEKKYWFAAKKYGWGWTPKTWQAWTTLIGWSVINFWYYFRIDNGLRSEGELLTAIAPVFIGSTLILFCISYLKGEPPRWRWGK